MKKIKSHFTFTKEQQNGIFLLILIIIVFQGAYFFIIPMALGTSSDDISVNREVLVKFKNEIDSLTSIEIEARKPKIYPFNPNYITDFRGASLGMTNEEIDRLLFFRKQGKWINSAKQFQDVTKISDSLLDALVPYFKFPEWVTNAPTPSVLAITYNNKPKTFSRKQDLNTASAKQLQSINGIGKILSERIIKFRNTFVGGFIADVQLQDVYGLAPDVIDRITNDFTVKTPRPVRKINLNTATIEQLVTIQHIDYDLAHNIVEQRKLREAYKSINELTKVKGFPINKIDIIKLYLSLD